MHRALFLDRDGIINQVVLRNHLPSSPRSLEEFHLIPEAIELANSAQKRGFLLVLATNQPDISRGLLSRSTLKQMHRKIQEHIPFDDLQVCTSTNDAYFRRKPNPGMLLQSASKLNISLVDSFFVGDSLKDLQAGKQARVTTILLQTDYNCFIHGLGDINCNNLQDIQKIIQAA